MCTAPAVAKMAKSCSLPGTETAFCEAEHPMQGYDQEPHQGILPHIGTAIDRTKMWKKHDIMVSFNI